MGAKFKRIMARYWQLYLFLLPPAVYTLIFLYYPMTGVQLAFKDFDYALGIWGSPWVGLRQFRKFFSSYMFQRVMTNTLRISFLGLLAGFLLPILFALCLNCVYHPRFKRVAQTITYLPHFISTVVLVGMLKQFFNPHVGIYGIVCTFFTGSTAADLFALASAFDPLYIISGVWQSFGWGSILYLAALSGVSPELYEAATIDGATRFQRVLHVDIPAILPTIIIMLIMNAGSMLNVGFEKIYLMQTDMNLRVSEVISTFVYKRGLGSGGNSDYAFSTAVGLFNNVINLILLVTVNRIAARVSETSLW